VSDQTYGTIDYVVSDYHYYYYKSTDYSDASLKLQGHFTYHIKKNDGRQ